MKVSWHTLTVIDIYQRNTQLPTLLHFQTLPINILRNVFSRFGNLIDIYLLPNKNCGYAKYATEESCRTAIETLHGAEICGVRMRVMEAEELSSDRKRFRRDE